MRRELSGFSLLATSTFPVIPTLQPSRKTFVVSHFFPDLSILAMTHLKLGNGFFFFFSVSWLLLAWGFFPQSCLVLSGLAAFQLFPEVPVTATCQRCLFLGFSVAPVRCQRDGGCGRGSSLMESQLWVCARAAGVAGEGRL